MRLYATIYPKPCHVRTTGYEDMLTSYALMLRKLELEKEKSGVVGPKGWAVRPLKRYASWVQNVVRQFGPYPAWAQDI